MTAAGKRYVVLAEGMSHDPVDAKTMDGVVRYSPHPTVAIVDSARGGAQHQGIPVVGTVAAATGYSPTTAIVGAAPVGGRLDDTWRALIVRCIDAGLDVESGLHTRLNADPDLRALAESRGVRLTDLREPPPGIGVPTGANLTVDATIVHTVGSDCAIGKKRMALELDLEARRRGLASVFVPTGQTGVAIAGWGVAVDAVVADFVAGAAEYLVVEGAKRGDLLWVEGQGSIVHPWYSAVTLGLYHGSAPHLLVLCHKAGQTVIDDAPDHPIPSLPELVERYENASLPLRPARVAAIALNTAHLDDAAARRSVEEVSALTGLPADDPVRFGAGRLVDAVLAAVPAVRR